MVIEEVKDSMLKGLSWLKKFCYLQAPTDEKILTRGKPPGELVEKLNSKKKKTYAIY